MGKRLKKREISCEWVFPQGYYLCTANGFDSHRYFYFTKREAIDDYYKRNNAEA